MTAAKNVGMRHRRIEKGSEVLEKAWRRANLRQSRMPPQRDATTVCSGSRAANRASTNSDSVIISARVELAEIVTRFVPD